MSPIQHWQINLVSPFYLVPPLLLVVPTVVRLSVRLPKRPFVFRWVLSEIHAMLLDFGLGKVFFMHRCRAIARWQEFKGCDAVISDNEISDSIGYIVR